MRTWTCLLLLVSATMLPAQDPPRPPVRRPPRPERIERPVPPIQGELDRWQMDAEMKLQQELRLGEQWNLKQHALDLSMQHMQLEQELAQRAEQDRLGAQWKQQQDQLELSAHQLKMEVEQWRDHELDMKYERRPWRFNDELPVLGKRSFDRDDWSPPLTGWARHPDDPADSLYREARELLNRGDWRKAATLLKDLPQKYPNSAYAPDALYWQAFALYRIGGSSDLREALTALETLRTKYPGARNQPDPSLATRIRGALAARGDQTMQAQISRAAADSGAACDREDQAVRSEALNALMQADPDGAAQLLQKVLSRTDECSVPLRRNAVFLIGSKRRDNEAIALLSKVAKTDASPEVRGSAIDWLSRIPSEEVLPLLDELARTSDDDRVQRAAVRALVVHPSAKARQMIRAFIDRNDSPEKLRLEAISAFDKERATSEDVTWLRGLYQRTDSPRIKRSVVYTLSRIGGSDVDQFLLSVARNSEESSETRGAALRRVAQTLSIADLGKLYDASGERNVRGELINSLSNRPEPEATDKLIEIVKNGTDFELRRMAMSALTRKKDPRTVRLLMEIIDK